MEMVQRMKGTYAPVLEAYGSHIGIEQKEIGDFSIHGQKIKVLPLCSLKKL